MTGLVEITFIASDGSRVRVRAEPGMSAMDAALDNGVDGILAQCGGACTCCTCHCYVDAAWQARVPAPAEDEREMLDYVLEAAANSRLACQIVLNEDLDGLTLRLPTRQV